MYDSVRTLHCGKDPLTKSVPILKMTQYVSQRKTKPFEPIITASRKQREGMTTFGTVPATLGSFNTRTSELESIRKVEVPLKAQAPQQVKVDQESMPNLTLPAKELKILGSRENTIPKLGSTKNVLRASRDKILHEMEKQKKSETKILRDYSKREFLCKAIPPTGLPSPRRRGHPGNQVRISRTLMERNKIEYKQKMEDYSSLGIHFQTK